MKNHFKDAHNGANDHAHSGNNPIEKLTPLEKACYDAVEAALLNSECSPTQAVYVALAAVTTFAAVESVHIGAPTTDGDVDGTLVCGECGERTIRPHTWKECVEQLRREIATLTESQNNR